MSLRSVRAITADFGFSFGLPAPAFKSVAHVDPPIEPPSKRRRISGVEDQEDRNTQRPSVAEARNSDHLVAEQHRECLPKSPTRRSVEDIATREPSKAVKKPQRARRKLQLEDGAEVPKTVASTKQDKRGNVQTETKPARRQPKTTAVKKVDAQSVEDTFVFDLKSRKRQTQKEERGKSEGQHEAEIGDALLGKQSAGNAKQTLKESQCEAENSALTEGPKLANQPTVKPPKASAKKLSKAAVAAATVKTDTDQSTSQAADTSVEQKSVAGKPKRAVKAKRSTKQSSKATTPIEATTKKPEGLTTEANEPPEKPTKPAKAKFNTKKHSLPGTQPDEDVDELSFDASKAPVHSLGPKKACNTGESKPVMRKSIKAAKALATKSTADSNDLEVATTTARRPRRQAAISAEEKVAMGYEEELVSVDKLRRAPEVTTRTNKSKKAMPDQVLPTVEAPVHGTKDAPTAVDAVSGLHEEDFSCSKKKPTKAVRKASGRSAKTKSTGHDTVKAVADVADPTGGCASTAEIHSAVIAKLDQPTIDTDKHAHKSVNAKPAPKKRQALAESDVNISKASPQRDGSEKPINPKNMPMIDHDDHPKLTVKSSRRPKSAKQDSMTKYEKCTDSAAENGSKTPANASKRSRKLQSAAQVDPSLDVDLASDQCTTSNGKNRKLAEDLDWLFDKPETNPAQPATARKIATKARRKLPDHNTKDLDFDDDFLESIAGFSGKLLTGRNGRVR